MTTTTSSKTYANLTNGDLSFTNIVANEIDVVNGASGVASFVAHSGNPASFTSGANLGMAWAGVAMETFSDGAGATQTVTVTYNVSASAGLFITSIDASYVVDLRIGDGTLVAVETIRDSLGNILATQTFTSGAVPPLPVLLSMGVQNATVTLTMTETALGVGADISASVVDQIFGQTLGTSLASIGDFVWLDANRNGIQDSGETGVAGVTVDLLNAAGTSVLAVTTTDASGAYHFNGLLAGTYEVKFINPVGESFTLATQGTNGGIDSNANALTGITAPIVLTAGQTDNTIDAGLILPAQAPSAALGDRVWFDTNANGIQDSGETGVAGVTVDLLNAAGTSVISVTTTNASGLYTFTNLSAGTYEVRFVAPSVDNFTLATQGTNTTADSNANTTTGVTAPVTLTAGQTDNTIDAGLVAKPLAALGDRVWLDTNANGIQDSGETGVAGVTVDLLNAAGTSILGVTTTNAAGLYSFTNLAAGTYEVQFIAPAADSFTLASQGTNPAVDSNANATTGITSAIVLAAGQTDLTIDAGLVAVPPPVDLSVFKTDGKTTVAAGSSDTYTITVTNNGPGTVTSFNMVDTIPAELLNPIWGTPSAGTYNSTTGLWGGVSLATGQSVSITLSGTISPTAGSVATYVASGIGSDGPESGGATITAGNGQIIVTLASNQINPTSAGQEVSGIQFTLGSAPTSVSLASASGTLIDIARGGAVTASTRTIDHWGVAQSGSTLTLATAGLGAVGGKPINLIIGAGPYSNANPSITGRDPHIQGTATFVINAPGVTPSTQIGGVRIEFGTGPDTTLAASRVGGSGSITNTVTVSAGPGYIDTNPNNNMSSDTDTITAPVTPPVLAALGNYVWFDSNGNGIQDTGETGVAGVTVDLLNALGTSILDVTTTNAAGLYSFTNLAAGTYEVQFVAPSGDNFTLATQGANGAVDSNANATTGITAAISLTAGQTDLTIDAGLVAVPQQVDLSVFKTDGKTTVAAGSWDKYTITVTNNGPGTVSSFNMVDTIPAELLNPIWGTPSAGTYNATTGLWGGVSLATGQSVSITLSGTISPTAGNAATYAASGIGSDGPESGGATITAGNGQIIVTLASNQINPTSAGQEVSGIQFTLGSAPTSVSLASASGTLIDIAPGGAATASTRTIDHWGVAQSGSTLTLATAGLGAAGGKPINLIIGAGPYSNANPSITGRDPHIQGTATFVINAPGVTPSTQIGGVRIEFGTGPDTTLAASRVGGSGSITNTVIVSAGPGYTDTNPNNNISSDTDTIAAPVTPLVLAANAGILANNIGIDGAMPAGSLTALYGKAQTLEFAYNPSSTVSTATNTIGASTGLTPGAMAFIEISNNSNPFASNAQIYFEGTVSSGQKLYADASIDPLTNLANTGVSAFMSTTAGQGLFAFVFNSPADFLAGVAPVQTNTYNTSGSQAMALNDQIGSLKTIGYIGSTGGHLTS